MSARCSATASPTSSPSDGCWPLTTSPTAPSSATTSRTVYGPTIAVYRNIEGDPDRVAALDADIARVGDSVLSDSATMEWEYLLLTARKA